MNLRSFFRNLLLFSIAITLITFSLSPKLPAKYSFPYGWQLLLFFVVTTALLHLVLVKNSDGKPQVFIRNFMAMTSFKLLIYLFIIVCYFLLEKSTAAGFIIHFMFFYVAFSTFEVISLLKHFRN